MGIDMNQKIEYCYASMRYFKEGEYHVTRISKEDVLLMVFEGILRFEEDGVSYEIGPGEYHIQRKNTFQRGTEASSCPQYLYIHFIGNWEREGSILEADGHFLCENMYELMEKMDYAAHNAFSLTECSSIFYQILSMLYQANQVRDGACMIADYIVKNLQKPVSLELLSKTFGYSRNHIINLFRKRYGMTPVAYLIRKRVERAQWLLEASGDTLEAIAEKCGFSDYSNLYKAFMKIHGKSPGQWRKEQLVTPYRV